MNTNIVLKTDPTHSVKVTMINATLLFEMFSTKLY